MQIDMSLKLLGGVDIMSMPALREWAAALISEHVSRAMTFPASIDLSFTGDQLAESAAEHKWPAGVATLDLQTVHMPKWQTQACMPSVVLKPAIWVDSAFACDIHAMTYPLVMDPRRPETMEPWQASFPIFDSAQVCSMLPLTASAPLQRARDSQLIPAAAASRGAKHACTVLRDAGADGHHS
jgi:hypothetical protein